MRIALFLALALVAGTVVAAPVAAASHPCHPETDPLCLQDDHHPLCRRGLPPLLWSLLCTR